MRYTLIRVVESLQTTGNHTQTRNLRVFLLAFEESLQTDTDAHEGFTGGNVLLDGLDIARVVELTETMAKVAYTRKNKFLGSLSVSYQFVFLGWWGWVRGCCTSAFGTSSGDLIHSTV